MICGDGSRDRSFRWGPSFNRPEVLRCYSRELRWQKLVLANRYRKLVLTYSSSHSCYLLPSPSPVRPRPRGVEGTMRGRAPDGARAAGRCWEGAMRGSCRCTSCSVAGPRGARGSRSSRGRSVWSPGKYRSSLSFYTPVLLFVA